LFSVIWGFDNLWWWQHGEQVLVLVNKQCSEETNIPRPDRPLQVTDDSNEDFC
jgi:hypothetical protein